MLGLEWQCKKAAEATGNGKRLLVVRGSNKASKSKMFDNLKEAMAFQKNWGGKLYVIDDDGQEYKYVEPDDDEEITDIDEENGTVEVWREGGNVQTSYTKTDNDRNTYVENKLDKVCQTHPCIREDDKLLVGKTFGNSNAKFYILNITKSRQLMNGFRYIKEMLLQNHNFRMYKAYIALKEKC